MLKNSFSRREKHKYEYNQTCNSTKDPKNILISQKHLSIKKNVSIKIPKHTHTHTHTQKTNLTNFIFQKQVKIVK